MDRGLSYQWSKVGRKSWWIWYVDWSSYLCWIFQCKQLMANR